jgi:hypothetical protein
MFVHTPNAKKNAFAFLPHTFRYLSGRGDFPKYALTFYRHEGTAAKPVATFGGLFVMLDPARIQGDPAQLTYQGLLSSATRGQYPDRSDMGVNGVWKLGHARPWTSQIHLEPNRYWNNTPLVERADLDLNELEQMLTNLQHQPAGTDAWYVFKKH